MRKVISITLSAVLLIALLAGCARKADWSGASNDTVVATVDGEEFRYDILKYIYYEKLVSAEITKDLDVAIDNTKIEFDKEAESYAMDDALNRLMCLAALSSAAQKEGRAWDRAEAYDYTVETLTGSVDQYPYMQSYLDMMCEKLKISRDVLLSTASDSLRILMDSDELAREALSEVMAETGSVDPEVLTGPVAEKLAKRIGKVQVTNNMTGQKKVIPDFSDYAREIVYLYMNN